MCFAEICRENLLQKRYIFRDMPAKEDSGPSIVFDKSELRERLTLTQYQVTQEHHTEK
jgi:hypothetical protein